MLETKDKYSFWPVLFIGMGLLFQMAWVKGFFHDGYLYAALGKHAALEGKWLVPHLSESVYNEFTHHPPFLFMLEGVFFKIFGVSYTSARIFGASFTLVTLGLIFFVLKKYMNKWAYFSSFIFILIPAIQKKSRFPNLDMCLMLLIFLAIYKIYSAIENEKNKDWWIAGLLFGLSLLIKGPIALLILPAIFIYLIVTKKLKVLKNMNSWSGLIFGLLIFGLWPLLLKINDKFYIFEDYLKMVFLETGVKARGVESNNPFLYFVFLFKQCAPWFAISIYLLVQWCRKATIHNYVKLNIIFMFNFLVIMSIPKFKYSHYIIPVYPSMAIISGYFLSSLKSKWIESAPKFLNNLGMTAIMALLIFPLTTKVRRDSIIHDYIETKAKEVDKKEWLIVDASYPYFSLANLVSFEFSGNVYNGDIQSALEKINSPGQIHILMSKENKELFDKLRPDLITPLIKHHYPSKNIFLIRKK